MKPQALRAIVWAQVCFVIGLAVAILLKPAGLSSNDGISYFGIYARTAVPYMIGLLGSAFLCWRASKHIDAPELALLKDMLAAFAVLTAVIVATPYSVRPILDWIHTTAGSTLFSFQLLLSIWLVRKLKYNPAVVALAIIELASGIMCAIYLLPVRGFLLQFQIFFQLAFGGLLIYSLRILQDTKG
jgi:hypothetical protein